MSDYIPPKVWTWNKESGGRFANINRPIAGPTHDKELRVGRHPIQLYSLGTPNGVLQSPDPFQAPVAVPPDPQLMQEIAQLSGGRSFNAQTTDELSSIYKSLGRQLGSVTRKRDVTAAFAIGGLAFLLLGAAGSTRWSGRLP